MVALDYPNEQAANRLIEVLKGIPCFVKVGMQLFYAAGPSFVYSLKEQGYHVFLDLKMHDIPNTVRGGAESITRLGVDVFNVHAAGGVKMMEAAMEGVAKAASASESQPKVIAVTQLTSTNEHTLHHEIGIVKPMADAVLHYASLAKQAGLHGVVASPQEVDLIKGSLGSSFITVTPGIRPSGAAIGDQSRVMTPKQAFDQGTDYVVIGRPITGAPDPRKAMEMIIEELLSE
ncbi:orotidine-5'-phosphate decarboxylase [Paenibacillus senegalensis]|uniref:orotidine-5'-phosphate decarboxylase n=1 Tax=Paenibacillus senegalensis TaxID=1465766 RepID=UPI0009D9810F|nr:orotidine-5'-phosphate decarboxylase [Paenibacillus senegalensis]